MRGIIPISQKLADDRKAFVMEACKNRHHPAIRKMEQLVFNGDNGPVDSIRVENLEKGKVIDML